MNALKPAVAIAAALFAGSGLAGTVKLTGFRFAGPMVATTNVSPPTGPFYVGEITGQLNGKDFLTYCTELAQDIKVNFLYSDFGVVAGATKWVAPKASDLNKLFTQNYASVSNSSTSAAMQLAVWEIIHETSGTYDVTLGNVTFSTDAAALSTANSWLHNLGSFAGPITYSIDALVSPSRQDLMVITPVPEPEGYALGFAGVATVVFLSRRRRRGSEAS